NHTSSAATTFAVRFVPPTSAISPKNAPECSSASCAIGPDVAGVVCGFGRDTVTVPSASQYNAVAGAPTSMIVEPAGYARAVITPISARAPGFDSADSSGAGGTCFGWRAISHF